MDIRAFLEEKYELFCRPAFIFNDPISIPHRFSQKEDIEISGFLTALLSWGQRPMIIRKATELMKRMDKSPYDYVLHANEKDFKSLEGFVYRTFNDTDCLTLVVALQAIYRDQHGLEALMTPVFQKEGPFASIQHLHNTIFEQSHLKRTRKHIARPEDGSAAKRINMFLRWMVRPSDRGVDFGIWNKLNTSQLICPLDIHSGSTARKLKLMNRTQNDRRAAEELTATLRTFDPVDPVKYDFALFGLGAAGFNR